MTTPTPQDIARAQGIVHAKVTIDGMVELIATALAAERSRWQAECAECERLREALMTARVHLQGELIWNAVVYIKGNAPVDPDKFPTLGQLIDAALARPAPAAEGK